MLYEDYLRNADNIEQNAKIVSCNFTHIPPKIQLVFTEGVLLKRWLNQLFLGIFIFPMLITCPLGKIQRGR